MNPFEYFKGKIIEILDALVASGALAGDLKFNNIVVEPPRDPSHGDLAANAAMVLAKPAGMSPRDLAALIVDRLDDLPDVTATDIAGPGFINITLRMEFWHQRLADILAAGPSFGDSTIGADQKVNVEYVSANPTGPMHVGPGRGAVVGDALASLLEKAGYDVTREYYINDAGAQIDTLARSLHFRYLEALGEDTGEIPEGLYPGEYLVPAGKSLAESFICLMFYPIGGRFSTNGGCFLGGARCYSFTVLVLWRSIPR